MCVGFVELYRKMSITNHAYVAETFKCNCGANSQSQFPPFPDSFSTAQIISTSDHLARSSCSARSDRSHLSMHVSAALVSLCAVLVAASPVEQLVLGDAARGPDRQHARIFNQVAGAGKIWWQGLPHRLFRTRSKLIRVQPSHLLVTPSCQRVFQQAPISTMRHGAALRLQPA